MNYCVNCNRFYWAAGTCNCYTQVRTYITAGFTVVPAASPPEPPKLPRSKGIFNYGGVTPDEI